MERGYCFHKLFIFTLIPNALGVSGESILLIGDSVDRFITVEWCDMVYGMNRYSTSRNKRSSNIWAVNHPHIKRWIAHTITSSDDPYFFCADPSNSSSIANVHMLGSAAKGPYYHDKVNLVGIPFRNSAVRLEKAIQLYISSFGRPSRVILNTILWDVLGIIEYYTSKGVDRQLLHSEGSEPFNQSSARFLKDQTERIRQLNALLNGDFPDVAPVDIALRTAAWVEVGGNLLRKFNNIIRQMARSRKLTLYDFDEDIYSTATIMGIKNSTASVHENVFRDWIHPRHYYTSMAGDKILGRRFSKYFFEKGRRVDPFMPYPSSDMPAAQETASNGPSGSGYNKSCESSPSVRAGFHKSMQLAPTLNSSTIVSLVRACGRLYYVDWIDNPHRLRTRLRVKWLVAEPQINGFLSFMRLGEGDIYDVTTSNRADSIVSSIPVLGTLPPIFGEGPLPLPQSQSQSLSGTGRRSATSCAVTTVTGKRTAAVKPKVYLATANMMFKQIPHEKLCLLYGVDSRHTYRGFYDQWIPNWNLEDPLPDIYEEGVLVQLKGSKQVFVVRNATKRPIASHAVFVAHNFSDKAVIVVDDKRYFDSLPTGDILL
jgi:hypothetical protein